MAPRARADRGPRCLEGGRSRDRAEVGV